MGQLLEAIVPMIYMNVGKYFLNLHWVDKKMQHIAPPVQTV